MILRPKMWMSLVVGALLLLSSLSLAQRPARNISHARHPNLAAAQRLSRQAWQRVLDAQKANEWDMDGHAQKAKELLDQVNSELKLAAQAANKNPRYEFVELQLRAAQLRRAEAAFALIGLAASVNRNWIAHIG